MDGAFLLCPHIRDRAEHFSGVSYQGTDPIPADSDCMILSLPQDLSSLYHLLWFGCSLSPKSPCVGYLVSSEPALGWKLWGGAYWKVIRSAWLQPPEWTNACLEWLRSGKCGFVPMTVGWAWPFPSLLLPALLFSLLHMGGSLSAFLPCCDAARGPLPGG